MRGNTLVIGCRACPIEQAPNRTLQPRQP